AAKSPVRWVASQSRTSARKAASAGVSAKSMALRRYLTDRSVFQRAPLRATIGGIQPLGLCKDQWSAGSDNRSRARSDGDVRAPGAGPCRSEHLYAAWCERVPFDNLVKQIHLVSRS